MPDWVRKVAGGRRSDSLIVFWSQSGFEVGGSLKQDGDDDDDVEQQQESCADGEKGAKRRGDMYSRESDIYLED